ncbi:integrin alpha-IIb isoform X4 [Cuculus canorus]|uniref:integrin alpha-IIb isoform X4 n=1 Tax=Cuculus canorus TaxID=55661 RepID=UPI0023AB441F|nr:integrin alpha-IIb isoform X4 [Cuculus canorus]
MALGAAAALLRALLLGGLCSAPTLGLLQDPPAVYQGPPDSYFGFALDFYQIDGRPGVAVGAPRANTSQPGVVQPGAVFLCAWPPDGNPCRPLPMDAAGDETETQGTLELHTYKSHQWLGASVTTWDGKLVACAPLQHWNAMEGQQESFRTPTGACFVADPELHRVAWYSPCRDELMANTYRQSNYAYDRRYCEIGFSAAVTANGRLVLGAPGGYFFMGLLYTVEVDAILTRFHGRSLLWPERPGRPTTEQMSMDYEDGYRGYSVAVGEFDDDPRTKEFVVGVPNKSNTRGEVEIFSAGGTLRQLQGIDSEQVASYFGHAVAVADVNGDGRDDVLVGAPLYLARQADGQRGEVGRLYLYLQRGRRGFTRPPQTLTGTHPYGRFAAAIASLGDLDKDGYDDVAVGAPFGGDGGSGQVFIFRGQSEGLMPVPTQRLNSPFPGPSAFGFALRGATDLDGNGYPDLLVGAYGAAKVAVYRGQPVVVARTQLSVPDGLNPKILACVLPGSGAHVSCFPVVLCVSVTGQRIPQNINPSPPGGLWRGQLLRPRPQPGRAHGQEKMSCNPKKENGTHVVLCELGNPMKAGAQITVDMELSVSGLEDMGDAITFQLQLRSKNSPSPVNVSVTVPVEAQAEMELRGNSLPATTVLPMSWHRVEGSRQLDDHGIRVEHVYQLHNKGPSTVSGVTLHLAVPSRLGGHILFYLLELGTEGGMSCTNPPNLNANQLEIPQPTGAAPRNGTHRRERREVEEPLGAGLEEPITVNCSNATCVDIICRVPSLAKDQRALVSIQALLWMDTLQQREHLLKQFLIQSQAWFNTSAMPYHVQPRVLPTGEAMAVTEVVRTSPAGEGAVPLWWVVLGVLAGFLLLTLLILFMWKVSWEGDAGDTSDALPWWWNHDGTADTHEMGDSEPGVML